MLIEYKVTLKGCGMIAPQHLGPDGTVRRGKTVFDLTPVRGGVSLGPSFSISRGSSTESGGEFPQTDTGGGGGGGVPLINPVIVFGPLIIGCIPNEHRPDDDTGGEFADTGTG
jgi:hypothetical protein